MSGIFTNQEDKDRFDSYTKEQIYEAYLLEHKERKRLTKEVNKLRTRLAEIKYKATL